MLGRRSKAVYYAMAAPLLKANGLFYRLLRAPRCGVIRVQLGPGQRNYLNGWVNIDANMFTAKCDVWADLRNPLPFHEGTIDAIYSHHVIEHLPDLQGHFGQAYRCLKPGGLYRVAGPNGDSAIKKFVEEDSEWFGGYPDARISLGGKFENFIFCRGEHLTILTYSYLEEVMSNVGFVDVRQCLPVKETNYPELFRECLAMEYESDFCAPHTLVVEARKPKCDRDGAKGDGEADGARATKLAARCTNVDRC